MVEWIRGRLWHRESKRQLVHGSFGLLFALAVFFFSWEISFGILAIGSLLTFFFGSLIEKGMDIPFFSMLTKETKRDDERVGSGVIWYFFGSVTIFVLFGLVAGVDKVIIAASMMVVATGDSVCTGLGRKFGVRRLPKTKTKTFEGTGLGFLFAFLFSFPLFYVGHGLVTSALVAGTGAFTGVLTEAYVKGNDNFTIPVIACFFMSVVYYSVI